MDTYIRHHLQVGDVVRGRQRQAAVEVRHRGRHGERAPSPHDPRLLPHHGRVREIQPLHHRWRIDYDLTRARARVLIWCWLEAHACMDGNRESPWRVRHM
jgi:hypothetical protein